MVHVCTCSSCLATRASLPPLQWVTPSWWLSLLGIRRPSSTPGQQQQQAAEVQMQCCQAEATSSTNTPMKAAEGAADAITAVGSSSSTKDKVS